jgi:ferredoxin
MISVHTDHGTTAIQPSSGSLLDMLEKANVPVVAQCRRGFCGACRTRVTKGEVEYSTDPLGFTRKGEVLACICRPKSNLEIDVRTVS